LDWRPVYSIEEALSETVQWYKAYQEKKDMYETCQAALQKYVNRAQELELPWSRG
jgi:dTDP-D-glucose 4,6-dehydratase